MIVLLMPDPPYAQLHGHRRLGCCGGFQQTSIGSETPTTLKQFYSTFPKNKFGIKKPVIPEMQKKICQLTLSVHDDFFLKL